MDLGSVAQRGGEWLRGTGPESDIVISSRVRLARNLADLPFPSACDEAQIIEAESMVRESIDSSSLSPELEYVSLTGVDEIDRAMLAERHLISREHAEGRWPGGVAFCEDETVSVMINEEDHIRIQAFSSGFRLTETYAMIDAVDDAISERVKYAFSPEFGYLTTCPTNVGTGMRASVMLHLPALSIARQIENFFRSVMRINLAVRGLYGEGTEALGNLYQVSNQITLGKSEQEILDNVISAVPQIVLYERRARDLLIDQNRPKLEDRIWRAYGMLQNARVISSEETLELLSHLRLGVHLELIDGLDVSSLNRLLVLAQPGHLQKLAGRALEAAERDAVRAELIRKALSPN